MPSGTPSSPPLDSLGRRELAVGDAVGVLPQQRLERRLRNPTLEPPQQTLPQQPLHRRRRPVRCPAPPARPSTADVRPRAPPCARARPTCARRSASAHSDSPPAGSRLSPGTPTEASAATAIPRAAMSAAKTPSPPPPSAQVRRPIRAATGRPDHLLDSHLRPSRRTGARKRVEAVKNTLKERKPGFGRRGFS